MKKTFEIQAGCYYLFESLASGKSCYFESEEEIKNFRSLFSRYLSECVEIHKMYLSSEGYQILLRVKSLRVLRMMYKKRCERRGVEVKKAYMDEVWRIVSEQMRIFHSVYVKSSNRIRGRKGVLVQSRFSRYYFDSKEEYEKYKEQMEERGEEIKGQIKEAYSVSNRWKLKVRWGIVRGFEWVESAKDVALKDYVVNKMLLMTRNTHSPPT